MFNGFPLVACTGKHGHVHAPCSRHTETENGKKTYNSGDSLVVTDLTTNPPVSCLYMAERTGSLVLKILWSYVKGFRPQYDCIHALDTNCLSYCSAGSLSTIIYLTFVHFLSSQLYLSSLSTDQWGFSL